MEKIPDAKVGVNGQIKLPKPTKMETFTTMDEDVQDLFVGSNHVQELGSWLGCSMILRCVW